MKAYADIYKNGKPIFKAELADSFFTRLSGLLGKKNLPEDGGMLIMPCRQVHTFFMKFPIDLIFLTKEYKITGIEQNVGKNRISGYYKEACCVLETAKGAAAKAGLSEGDTLEIGV